MYVWVLEYGYDCIVCMIVYEFNTGTDIGVLGMR